MHGILDINNIFFTIMGHPMSYIEFFGTLLNIWSVWLVARNKILNWPIGILGTILFGVLFWQIHLYSDFFEQIYYFITGFWGWWVWSQSRKNVETPLKVSYLSNNMRLLWIAITLVGSFLLGYFVAHIHIYFPTYFPVAASYAYLDAATTVMSFVATYLLIRKKIDSWYLWILVDVIGIWLYWVKDVHFISLLYALFLVMATQGLFIWVKTFKREATPLL